MENTIINQSGIYRSSFLILSRFISSLTYYGVKGIVPLYIFKELQLERNPQNALLYFSLITLLHSGSQFISGIIADLVLGNRRSMILGNSIAILGGISLCIQSEVFCLIGLILLSFGIGYSNPNQLAWLIKDLGSKQKKDWVLTLQFTLINIGAFFGPFLFSSLSQKSILIAMIACVLLLIANLIISILLKAENFKDETPTVRNLNYSILVVITCTLILPAFWFIYNFNNLIHINAENHLVSEKELQLLTPFIVSISGIMLSILWAFLQIRTLFKIAIGFLFLGLSTYLLNASLDWGQTNLFYAAFYIFSISEILVIPLIISAIAQEINTKYITIFCGALPVFVMVSNNLLQSISNSAFLNSEGIQSANLVICGTVLIILLLFGYKARTQEKMPNFS